MLLYLVVNAKVWPNTSSRGYYTYMNAHDVENNLHAQADPLRAQHSQRFFKTKAGEYGEGDQFLGVTVPIQRKLAKEFKYLPLPEIVTLLHSPYHECRLTAIFILVYQYNHSPQNDKDKIFQAYLENTEYINNWDIVDSSAGYIVGAHLGKNYQETLTRLARSDSTWDRRIAMIACLHYIMQGNPEPALMVIELLKYDQHDLIQKAVGWMLREIGKRCSRQLLEDWLTNDKQYQKLPRTTLRYAIEHFDTARRKQYLSSAI